mgnify:FL=1|tara:strand:- start:4218 stop:5414 length:1197 start_codon:yes stop_codon:yes gene_type:complete
MNQFSPSLFLEINSTNFIFFVGEKDDQDNFKIIYNLEADLEGIDNNRIFDLEKVFIIIKEKIYLIEQKLNFTFKEVILILENFNPKFVNLTGFKKLNGSQVLRENIIYILNTLKSSVDKIESSKTILNIFNSGYNLDNKKIENLPIGLFGDFYSHELSFILINSNDYNNIKSILENCNLKIKKILLKSFIKGAHLSEINKNTETFFHIKLNDNSSRIFYFENNSLKFEQSFKFGQDIIIKDISKITSLKKDTIYNILSEINFEKKIEEDEIIDEKFFENINYRKIKKKLIYEIIIARFKEILELILLKNINLKYYNKSSKLIFFEHSSKFKPLSLIGSYKNIFNEIGHSEVRFLDSFTFNNILHTADKLVHYGWKKEAIPVTQSKKSIIVRLFDAIFG